MAWQLQQAKQHFSQVVSLAEQAGPQVVTKHGREAAVVISIAEYRRMRGESPRGKEFARHLLAAPGLREDEWGIAFGQAARGRSTDGDRPVPFDDGAEEHA
jgi:prevent-host-death family protein